MASTLSDLFSTPQQQASQSAAVAAQASDAQIQQEEAYVNSQEANLRGAIAGLPPDPYTTATANVKPPSVSPAAANYFTAPVGGTNLFAPTTGSAPGASTQRQTQPAVRSPQ